MHMREATPADTPAVAAMVTARMEWMRDRSLQVADDTAEAMAAQTSDDTPMWVLVDDGKVLGCTSTYTHSPPWGFTEAEQAIPSLFLASTWTIPNDQHLGHVIARWAIDYAAKIGLEEVRRGTSAAALVAYYRDVQGWTMVREVERRGKFVTFLTRHVASDGHTASPQEQLTQHATGW